MTSPEGRLFDALIALKHQAVVVLTAGLVGTLDGCHQGLVEHPVIDGSGDRRNLRGEGMSMPTV